jgi:hypothetical protein
MSWQPSMPYLEVHNRLEMFVPTLDHPFVSPPVSVTDQRLRTKVPNPADASDIGYYLSVNANCFCIKFSVERISILLASWVSTRNAKGNRGSALASLGERYVR